MKASTILLSTWIFLATLPAHGEPKAPDEVAEGLARIAKPFYNDIEQQLRVNPTLNEAAERQKAALKAVAGDPRLKTRDKELKLAALSARFEPMLKQIFREARIDEVKYAEMGERFLKRMAERKNMSYQAKYLGYLGWYWKFDLPKRRRPKPADKEITLTAPFPFEQKTVNGEGETRVDKTAGTYSVQSLTAFAGAHDNSAGLAHFFEVDDRYARIEASLALPETQWSLSGFADFLAVFGSNAKSRVEIFNNNRVVCQQDVEHGNLLAPILYWGFKSGSDNIVVDCEIPSPRPGDEIVLRATSVAGAWGGGLGVANARVDAQPRDLRLLLKY